MPEQDEQIRFRNPIIQVGYAQMWHVITLDQSLSDGAYRLYALYIKYAQQKDACWPGRDMLAKLRGVSEATITRQNQELEKAGYITRERRPGRVSITWIEDVSQIQRLKDYATGLLIGSGDLWAFPDGDPSAQKCADHRLKNEPSIGSKMSRHEEESCKKNHEKEEEPSSFQEPERKTEEEEPTQDQIPVLVDEAAGLTVLRDDALKVSIEIGPHQQGFSCPECGTYHKFPTSKTKRRRPEALHCERCGALFCVSILDPDGIAPPTIYDHPNTVQYYVRAPALGVRWETDEDNGEDFIQNWHRDPGKVQELIAWVLDKDIPAQFAVARINTAIAGQVAGVKTGPRSIPAPEPLPEPEDDEVF